MSPQKTLATEVEILHFSDAAQSERLGTLMSDDRVEKVDSFAHQVSEWNRIAQLHGQEAMDPNKVGAKDGCWVYYPWRGKLVHLLEEEKFIRLRTDRNRNKITSDEQRLLGAKKIGIIGMSVGRAVATTMALERIFGELRISDMDTLDLSNLNRLKAPLTDLGLSKTESVLREIAGFDPFLNVKTWGGMTPENIENFILDGGKLDVLVDECDSLEIKVLCRLVAKKHRIPVVMETSDRGMLDVERFDLEPDRPIFHGRLGADIPTLEEMKDPEVRQRVFLSIVDLDLVSERGKSSLMEVGKTLLTWPQLASAVMQGGGVVCDTVRRILLDEHRNSGRFYVDLAMLTGK